MHPFHDSKKLGFICIPSGLRFFRSALFVVSLLLCRLVDVMAGLEHDDATLAAAEPFLGSSSSSSNPELRCDRCLLQDASNFR